MEESRLDGIVQQRGPCCTGRQEALTPWGNLAGSRCLPLPFQDFAGEGSSAPHGSS